MALGPDAGSSRTGSRENSGYSTTRPLSAARVGLRARGLRVRRPSGRTVVTLLLVLTVAATASIVSWLDIRDDRNEFRKQHKSESVAVTRGVAALVADMVYVRDIDGLREAGTFLIAGMDVIEFESFDDRGRLLVGPGEVDYGAVPPLGDLPPELLASGRPTIELLDETTIVLQPIMADRKLIGAVRLTFDGTEFDEAIQSLIVRRAWQVGLLTLGFVLVVALVAHVATRPVRRLSAAAKRLARGHLDARVEPGGPRELHELGESFNGMAEALESSHLELQELYRAPGEFVSSASHELKTPLTAARAFTDLLCRDREGTLTGRQKKFVEVIARNQNRLSILIGDLLDVGRIEAGTFNLETERVDVAAVLAEVRESFELTLREKHQRFAWDVPSKPVTVDADPQRLAQIVGNLVSNASKYSPERTEIRVSVNLSDGDVRVSVKDQGPGVSEADLARLFTPFFRTEDAVATKVEGTGLGLYVALALAQQHGGRIDVDTRPGSGSVFTLAIPRESMGGKAEPSTLSPAA